MKSLDSFYDNYYDFEPGIRFLWYAKDGEDTPIYERGSRRDLQKLRTNEYTFISTA